ncbi:MAG TPA: YfhO family protein [Candidatus Kapabacteria bacterium]|nr:YfhO family protein [Candidatus Kapabacteria bacterium]
MPTDEFDTMTLPYSAEYGPPQAYNHNLTDALMQSYPWKVYEQQALHRGTLAYWNPLILNGYPQYASSRQSFDLFNVLLLLFDLPFAFTLLIVLQLFVAGVGMYLLLRWHGRGRLIALLFASAWMLNGMFLTHALNLWATATFCWVPFLLAFLLKFYQQQNSKWGFCSALLLACTFFGSTLQSAAYVIIILAAINYSYCHAFGRPIRSYFTSTLSIVAVAIAFTAIMWLPTIELFLEVTLHGKLFSPTHETPYTLFDRLLSIALIPVFFIPELLGQVRSLSLTSIANVHPLDFSGSLGFVELLMAAWAVFSMKHSSKDIRGYGWLMILGFLLPILTPLYAWLYHRFFIVALLGATVLGAERFEAFVYRTISTQQFKPWLKWATRLCALIAIFILVLNVTFTLDPHLKQSVREFSFARTRGTAFADGNDIWVQSRIEGTFHHYSVLSLWMIVPFIVIAGSLLLLWIRARWKYSINLYLLCFLALSWIHSIFFWHAWLPMLDAKQFPLLPQHSSIQFLQSHSDNNRLYLDRHLWTGQQYVFLDNLPSLYGLSTISAYESEVPASFYPTVRGIVTPSKPHARLLGLLGVKYLVTAQVQYDTNGLTRVDSGRMYIYQNSYVRPRASMYYNSRSLKDNHSVLTLLESDSIPEKEVLFSEEDEHAQPVHSNDTNSNVRWLLNSNEKISVRAQTASAGYLVLSDTYYPGWVCYIDGKEHPIYRANYAMRAVFLDPGTHTITFEFQPLSFRIGLWISLLAFAGACLYALITATRNRNKKIDEL